MQFTKSKGFTLIEMAIVLVIIGIILAGVMKGRDIVRGSQVKQFSQGFAQKWQTIASTYVDKVGQHFTDGTRNGGRGAINSGNADGYMDNIHIAESGSRIAQMQPLRDVGITPCTMIKSDLKDDTVSGCSNNYNVWERMIDGEFTGKTRVSVGFANFNLTDAIGTSRRNVVFFENMPLDVAQGLDTLVDGVADGRVGSCVCVGASATEVAASPLHTTTNPAPAQTSIVYPSEADDTPYLRMVLILDY